ncbi:MAG: methyltransferase domain-containing protein [Planctomycetes bacterium]|nr:methyltransferase domain-containing protein [Planctomycetota bacterium]
MAKRYGIAVFRNKGDVISCTPVAAQLKADEPDCHVTWFSSTRHGTVLENHPHVDELVLLDGDPAGLDATLPALCARADLDELFTPAAYHNYARRPGAAIFELVQASLDRPWTVPFVFDVRLTGQERAAAGAWWEALPRGPRVLVETEFLSDQSAWTDACASEVHEALAGLDPLLVFSAGGRPPFLDALLARGARALWCDRPFRWNLEFFNRCDAFVGVSSGISTLCCASEARRDVPRLEFTRGWHWSAACLPGLPSLRVAYSRRRFRAELVRLAARLRGAPAPAAACAPSGPPRCPLCESGTIAYARASDAAYGRCVPCGHVFRLPGPVADLGPPPAPAQDPALREELLELALRAHPGPSQAPSVFESHAAAAPAHARSDVVLDLGGLDRADDPHAWLDRLHERLAPRGVLACLCANRDALGWLALGADWGPRAAGGLRHLWSRDALRAVLAETGFRILGLRAHPGPGGNAAARAALRTLRPDAPETALPALVEAVLAEGRGDAWLALATPR